MMLTRCEAADHIAPVVRKQRDEFNTSAWLTPILPTQDGTIHMQLNFPRNILTNTPRDVSPR